MRYLLPLLFLVTPVYAQQVAVIPCPAKGMIVQWVVDDQREIPVIKTFLETKDIDGFVKGMAEIDPRFGEVAQSYVSACFTPI